MGGSKNGREMAKPSGQEKIRRWGLESLPAGRERRPFGSDAPKVLFAVFLDCRFVNEFPELGDTELVQASLRPDQRNHLGDEFCLICFAQTQNRRFNFAQSHGESSFAD